MPGAQEALHRQEAITVHLPIPTGLLRVSPTFSSESGYRVLQIWQVSMCLQGTNSPIPEFPTNIPGLNRRNVHQRAMDT